MLVDFLRVSRSGADKAKPAAKALFSLLGFFVPVTSSVNWRRPSPREIFPASRLPRIWLWCRSSVAVGIPPFRLVLKQAVAAQPSFVLSFCLYQPPVVLFNFVRFFRWKSVLLLSRRIKRFEFF
jgi:hypothetical protein